LAIRSKQHYLAEPQFCADIYRQTLTMHQRLSRFVLIFFLACACKKPSDGPTNHTFQDGKLTISDPADSSFFPAHQKIDIHATVTGLTEEYSFLEAYIYTANEENWTIDTVLKTDVARDGSITATLPATLSPGLYTFHLTVLNPYNTEQKAGDDISLYIGQPPAVQITSLEKDDTSIVINWSKSDAPNFKAYEIYGDPGINLADKYPDTALTLLGRVTNRDQLSFRHDSVQFFYPYSYFVKVVTKQSYSSNSAIRQIQAGSYIEFGDLYDTHAAIHDPKRGKIYLRYYDSIRIINPATLSIENSVHVPYPVHYLNKAASGDNLDCIFKLDMNSFQAASIDLDTWQITMKEQFRLPTYTFLPGISVAAFMNNTAFFTENPPGPPFTSSVTAYNISNGTTRVIADADIPELKVISDNRIVVSSAGDSFLVFKQDGDVFTRIANVPTGEYITAIHEAPGYVAVGSQIFDQSFNLLHQLPPREDDDLNWILGFSDDGKYAVTAENKIMSTANWQVVRTYGNGFGTHVYFSADNKTLYQFTELALGAWWNPPSRLFRFPWTH
jgi:hypothetical protein